MDELTELRIRYERLNKLHQVSQVIHSTLDVQKALELIVGEAVRLMRATSGSLVLVNPMTGFLEIQAAQGLPAEALALKLRLGEGITGWVAQTGHPTRVGDVRQDPRYFPVRPQIRSELAVPLEVNEEVRGALNVDSEALDAFTGDDLELLQDLASQAVRVIHNTWLYEQLRLKARLFESLVSVGQTINTAVGLDESLELITREAVVLMKAKMCSILMLDESGQWLVLRASHGAGPAYLAKPPLNVEDSLLGVVARRRRAMQVENVQVSSQYQSVEVARQENLVSLLSVPLVYQERSLGSLNVYTGKSYHFSNEEIRILCAMANLSAIAIEKARLYEKLVDMEEQLRQREKLSALGLLAAEVAHEIRNPLTVMKMLFHSLNLEFPEADPRANDVRLISAKIDHLNRIVEQALDFARNDEPQRARLNINKVIEDLAMLVRHKMAQQNVRLSCQLETGLPVILGDSAQLEQAFLNLILNALEAMSNGGDLAISTRSVRSGKGRQLSQVLVEFRDNGQGMTEDQQRRTFTSLLRTTKTKGAGLGLAIVARVIENHQGKIKVQSQCGKGTVFRLFFPIESTFSEIRG